MILFWPVIATGLFDRDVTDEQAVKYPALYETGRLGLEPLSAHGRRSAHLNPGSLKPSRQPKYTVSLLEGEVFFCLATCITTG